jgi:hypothetical protein
MTSPRQIAANRENARKSTGPRTPGGRARSAKNARRHGLAVPLSADPDAREVAEAFAERALQHGLEGLTATVLGQYYAEIARIGHANDVLFTKFNAGEISAASFINALERVSRYQSRAAARRNRLIPRTSHRRQNEPNFS